MDKRKKVLISILYKTERRIMIIFKNAVEKWNLRAKITGLKEIKEKDIKLNKGRNKTKDKSKKSRKKKNNNEKKSE